MAARPADRTRQLAQAMCLCLALGSLGCATSEGFRLDRRAERAGQEILAVRGGDYPLRVYLNPEARDGSDPLHIYLEGDGQPWIAGRYVAADPHGRNNVAFDLMLKDPSPSAYVQRPCYHLAPEGLCDPELWTHGRYSETVVSSLVAGVDELVDELGRSDRGLVLVGYSGGGVLAYLLASRIDGVQAVITVAANLDVEAWADHHGYEPLVGSLNPVDEPPLPTDLLQVHWLGGRDSNVPAELIPSTFRDQPGVRVEVIPDFDHGCCWVDRWPELLEESLER